MPGSTYTTGVMRAPILLSLSLALGANLYAQTQYKAADGKLRVALAQQPLGPNGPSKGPDTMAGGGIQKILASLGATTRVERAQLTPLEETEYGGWKKLGLSLGHFADIVTKNERDGYFTVGLLATCPSMPGLVVEQLSVDDLRNMTPAVWQQMDRLNRISDQLYIHIDMDVLDPREVMAHGNKVPNGPSSEQLERLFEEIFKRYPKASAIGFATIPPTDEGGLSIAALNRMIAGAVRGVRARP